MPTFLGPTMPMFLARYSSITECPSIYSRRADGANTSIEDDEGPDSDIFSACGSGVLGSWAFNITSPLIMSDLTEFEQRLAETHAYFNFRVKNYGQPRGKTAIGAYFGGHRALLHERYQHLEVLRPS